LFHTDVKQGGNMEDYWKHFTQNNYQINLAECGVEQYSKYDKREYNVRRHYVIHYIESGLGYYEVNGKRYKLSAGDGFILRKSDRVKYYSDTTDPWKCYWIAIKGGKTNEVLGKTILSQLNVCHFNPDSTSIEIMKKIVKYNKTHSTKNLTNLWNHSQLYNFLYYLNVEFPDEREISSLDLDSHQLADLVIDFIHENYNKNILVQDIAHHFNISRSYMYKICKKNFDSTPKEMILKLRMENSEQMLLHTDLLIKEIANEIGFKNQFYFSKSFKNYYGHSPSEYRKLDNN